MFSHWKRTILAFPRKIRPVVFLHHPQLMALQTATRGESTDGRVCIAERLRAAAKRIAEVGLCGQEQPAPREKSEFRAPDSGGWRVILLRQRGSAPSQTPETHRRLLFDPERKKEWRWADDPSHGAPRHSFDGALNLLLHQSQHINSHTVQIVSIR